MAVSKVAPPHISIENIWGQSRAYASPTRSMSRVRTRVARSDWLASRKVVSVISRGVCADPAGEPLGPHLLEHLPRALGRGGGGIERGRGRLGGGDVVRRANDPGVAVDCYLGGEGQDPRGTVLTDREPEQLGRVIDEPGGAPSREEVGVRDDVEQEGHVRLDAPDAELLEPHAPSAAPRR